MSTTPAVASFDRKAFTISCLAIATLATRVREQDDVVPGRFTRALCEVIVAHILYGQPGDTEPDITDAEKRAESGADRLIAWAATHSQWLPGDQDLPTIETAAQS